ncbi:protein-disulfide reductase DsbD N-terminal domain-containing protein, partial [Bordetella petrii]|uniref:protein-disulfide reductase DsbD N-terminal domain-containing protein n=1 Tax=Bordetella petrii TaxID=94624 RepID=UPI001E37CAD0
MLQFMVRGRHAWHYGWACLVLLAVWAMLAWRPAAALTEQDFLPPEQAFVFSAAMANSSTLELRYRIAPGYYMYRERFGLVAAPQGAATLGEASYPQGEVKYDPTFEKNMEVYHQQVVIAVPVSGNQAFTLTVTSQGCADAGLCYPPADHTVRLTPVAGGYAVDGAAAAVLPGAASPAKAAPDAGLG